ncbi:MAG: molybdopterin molybdotransferase MoeA [Elusimicrobia bacterium]|nr:molybdopterin molybdotransferase MoeA [Elusimicrobiota bacterium]
MIDPKEALELIINNVRVLPSQWSKLENCIERPLAEDIKARQALPPFDNSAMDGYAIRHQDSLGTSPNHPMKLSVRETVRAGSIGKKSLGPQEAIRIMTGAPLPRGADAVVMQEATRQHNGAVEILQETQPGENVRRLGEDIKAGSVILHRGQRLRPFEIALLASQGITKAPVARSPKVAVIATGDELIPANKSLTPGKIRNSNGPAIAAEIKRWGCQIQDFGIAPDNPESLKKILTSALKKSDIALISGGVSVGDFDFTKASLDELGLKTIFWKTAIKPGKPLLFGLINDKSIFGLPGNPVSVLVCLEEFVRPALEKMQGLAPRYPSYHLKGIISNDYAKEIARQQYLFCRAHETPQGFSLHIIRPQGSAMLSMATQANALALAPIGLRYVTPGMEVAFRWLK